MGNTICHVEIVAEDIAASAGFYSKVFGWNTIPMGEEYMLWTPGEETTGGGFTKEPMHGQRTVVYIKVDDMEATLAEIEVAGGQIIHLKTQISDEHGYFAMFTDPNGTLIGLWSKT